MTITTGVKDLNGRPIANIYWFKFLTKGEPISSSGGSSEMPPSPPKTYNLTGPTQSLLVKKGDKARFALAGESHTISIDYVIGSQVKLIINSSPIIVVANVNEPSYVDIDGDGVIDLEILVTRVYNGAADVTFILLGSSGKEVQSIVSNKKPAPYIPSGPTTKKEATPEKVITNENVSSPSGGEATPKLPLWTIGSAAIIVLTLIGIGYYYIISKKS